MIETMKKFIPVAFAEAGETWVKVLDGLTVGDVRRIIRIQRQVRQLITENQAWLKDFSSRVKKTLEGTDSSPELKTMEADLLKAFKGLDKEEVN